MSSIESFDGLCGKIPTFASSDLRIRCKYEIGHYGPCSYEKYRNQFTLSSCCSNQTSPEQGFLNSVLSSLPFEHQIVMITSDNKLKIRK